MNIALLLKNSTFINKARVPLDDPLPAPSHLK